MTVVQRLAFALVAMVAASCSSIRPSVQPALGATSWTSFDGKEMPWRAWRVLAGTHEKAVIIAVHGLSGAASDFWLLGERLPPKGISVYAYELRGQGNDPDAARRGDISSSKQWLKDLLAFNKLVHDRHPGVPVIWYGESLGTLIALHTATKLGTRPDALILASPVAGLRMNISELERLLLRAGSRVAPGYRVKLGDLAGMDENKMRVTSTSTHGGQMNVTPHHVAAFSLRLIREIGGMLDDNERAAKSLTIPVLMLGSPHDVVSSPDQVQTLFGQIGSEDKVLHWYSRSYHLLLHDVQHDQVINDLLHWLDRISSRR